ncbi:MAG: hypothetical protein IPH22_07760 [Nitrosomonas sp.]|nr:hypothetical protein [Nitrosomonas sp.]
MPNAFLFRRNQKESLHCSLSDRILILATIILISLSFNSFSASPDEITGELDVIHKDDFDNHIHLENDYFLRDDNGVDWHQLHFDRTPPDHLRSGQRIRVKGRQNGRKFRVESLEEQSSANGRGSNTGVYSTTTDSASTADAMAIDERRAVVILVDLTNAKTGSYTTPAQVAGKMFTDARSVDGLYREASLGQMSFPADTDGDGKPDVFGPFAINYDNATCDYYSWAYAAEAAAQLAGLIYRCIATVFLCCRALRIALLLMGRSRQRGLRHFLPRLDCRNHGYDFCA